MASYQEAGVDLEAAERHTSAISGLVTESWGDDVVGVFGGFAAGIQLPGGYRQPILMMTTDGVGTKLEIARSVDTWEGVGFDLVAMCVDDLAAAGATPLAMVDYMAVGELHPARDRTIVDSIAKACIAAGCALLGGETAEHPGVMAQDAVDLAGAALGVIEKDDQPGPHRVRSGDVIVGLESPNLRSNGFSLVRAVLGEDTRAHARTLLEPSVIYSPSVTAAFATGSVHAAAHITGGGIVGNLSRVLPEGLGATIDTATWEPPPVFSMIADRGVERDEMFRTFNMGIGFCLVVSPEGLEPVLESARLHHPTPIGEVSANSAVVIT